MKAPAFQSPDSSSPAVRPFPIWVLLLLALMAWHGWMTLGLFGPWPPWQRLVDDEPIVNGRHPANLYLGLLGARAIQATGNSCSYDPAFQAGYPSTPILNGSRLAELYLLCAGGGYQPAAYKLGLAVTCFLAPLLLFLAARCIGLSFVSSAMAVAAGLLVWWGKPGLDALRGGEIELQVGALAMLAHAGLLALFHQSPGLRVWFGLIVTGGLAWFCQPLLLPLFVPLALVYYLSVGVKHRAMTWHWALLGAWLGTLLVNAWWLVDWVSFWWVRAPLGEAAFVLPHRTFRTIWNAPIWGEPADRFLAALLLAGALVGIGIMNQGPQRPAARILGLGMAGLLTLAVLGISWEPLGRMGSAGLLVPALWFATLPAVQTAATLGGFLSRKIGRQRAILAHGVLLIGLIGLDHHAGMILAPRAAGPEPFSIGLGAERLALIENLSLKTGPEARILWEDRQAGPEASHWTALLPLLTNRSFVGGLDPECSIVHSTVGLSDQTLDGRHISTWNDVALEEYCRLYNIGWIVCWSRKAVARVQQWPGAVLTAQLTDNGAGYLFSVQQHVHSFTLKGQAQLVEADSRHVTLADVTPESGVVVLSLHYQTGIRALPSRVQVEREPDAQDPVGFLRLRVASPVARVTLTWDDR
jgi:hypothetical protein